MEITLIILSGILLITGFLGCILPILPSTPISFVGLLLLHFTSGVEFTNNELALYFFAMVIAQVTDYLLPVWFTKQFGGSKWGVRGSAAGMIVGFFFGPLGIIFGPMVGAFIGELISGKEGNTAFRSAIGSFLGFILNTGIKLAVCGWFIWIFIQNVW